MKSTRAIVSTVCVLAALLVTATASLARGTDGAKARGRVTLTVWDWSSPPPAAMKELDDAFMKQNPDITIKRVHQPFNSYFTLLRTAVATRKGPDVFEGYATPFMFDYLNGMLPLTKYRTAAQKKDLVGWAGLSANLNAERHAVRDAVDRPGHQPVLQQGALQEGRPGPERAAEDVGAVPGRMCRAQEGGHHADRRGLEGRVLRASGGSTCSRRST